jgi:tRNA isopentenyl-2-thiomethyl-A-37 hydroxylase MiaE
MRKLVDPLIAWSEMVIRRNPKLRHVVKRELDRFPQVRERLRRRAIRAASVPQEPYGPAALSARGREILSQLLRTQDTSIDR